jgi:hypothetical protein
MLCTQAGMHSPFHRIDRAMFYELLLLLAREKCCAFPVAIRWRLDLASALRPARFAAAV